jgi:hypothetical protein
LARKTLGCLSKKADIHAVLSDKLHLDEVQDSIARLEHHVETINSAERLAGYLTKQMHHRFAI